jgi:2-methylcitrate dehydratase PrpD
MASSNASVTEQVADWVVNVGYDDLPQAAIDRVPNLVLDSIGNQFAGLTVRLGTLLSEWVRAQGATPECTVTGSDLRTSASYATLLNGATSHALENDDIATFSSHPNSPLTASSVALGEKLGVSGRDLVLAWVVGWEITAQTMKPVMEPLGNGLINRGWFNQGFQECLGVAALSAKLLGLDVDQTRMALGHAASAMGGVMKNRGSDTKGFTAGNAAMHGVMAAELAALGFTANPDIFDGEFGVARMLGLENGDPEKILDGLGTFNLATHGATLRLHASCAAAHWSMDAIQNIVRRRPVAPEEIEAIEVEFPAFLESNVPYTSPQSGLEAKYSLEFDVVTIALYGKGGIHEYTDEKVQNPVAQSLMQRVKRIPTGGGLESRVVLKLTNGEELEDTVTTTHGTPLDPLTQDEILGKFHETAGTIAGEEQRQRIIDLCAGLADLADVRTLAGALAVSKG